MSTGDTSSQPSEDREIVDLGPIRLERVGRVLYMRSSLDAESHNQLMARWRDHRPELKESIDQKIQRLRERLGTNNPLLMLSQIAAANLLANPEQYKEVTHEGSEASVELAMSLATGLRFAEGASAPGPETIDECIQLSREILNDCFWYYGTEVAEKGDKGVETEIRQLLLGKALQIRGDAFWPHVRQTFLEMYSPLGSELVATLGVTPTQFLESLEWAEAEINNHVNSSLTKAKTAYDQARQSHELFKHWSKGKEDQYSTIEEMMTAFANDHPDAKKAVFRFHDALSAIVDESSFAVVPRNAVDKTVFDSVSIQFGDNVGFWEDLPRYRGWPLNNSAIRDKPVIRHGGKYFFFHVPLTLRSVTSLLASVATEEADTKLQKRLMRRRDDYLEKKGIELLSAILRGCKAYRNLYYPSDSGQRWLETDGLIVYGDVLLIFEAKAGRLSPAAWRGALQSFKTGVKEIVGVANQQGLNVLNYLKANDVAQFYDERRQPKVSIKVTDFSNIFLINVTLEQLGTVATHISWISDLGIIKGKEWPWVVNLNDLRAISEIVEHPTEFIHYLTRRLRANDIVQLQLFDELDFFMLYLKEGLYWRGTKPSQNTMITATDYTEELDAYYLYREGKRSPVPKPRQPIPDGLHNLIAALENGRPDGFVRGCLALYECDDETRTQIGNNIERMDKECGAQAKPKSISLVFSESRTALLIAALPSYAHAMVKQWADRYSSEHGASSVIVVTWEPPINRGSVRVDLFDYGVQS